MVDDLCFLVVPLSPDFGVGDVEFLQETRHQDRVTHDVAVVQSRCENQSAKTSESVKHRQYFTLTRRKWWPEKIRPFVLKREMRRFVRALEQYHLFPLQPQMAVTLYIC